MTRIVTFLILLTLPLGAHAQFEYFNSEAFWSRLRLRPATERAMISADDTVIVVASNRVLDTGAMRYLPEVRDGKRVRYFVVYSHEGSWMVQPVTTLKQAVSLVPDRTRAWVVYAEGMGKFFTSDVDRGMRMAAQYGVNVILLDYPSITAHKKRLGNYFFAKKNAALAHRDFTPVLDTIRRMQTSGELGPSGVNLFFHSMGNIMLRQIIRSRHLHLINQPQWVNNLILNAPCIPQRRHHKLIDRIGFAREIYIHYNPADFTLGGAYMLSKRYQLGKQVRKPLSSKVTYVNFNTLVDDGHSYFLSLGQRSQVPQAAFRHYDLLFHGSSLPLRDTRRYRNTSYRGIGYDILP